MKNSIAFLCLIFLVFSCTTYSYRYKDNYALVEWYYDSSDSTKVGHAIEELKYRMSYLGIEYQVTKIDTSDNKVEGNLRYFSTERLVKSLFIVNHLYFFSNGEKGNNKFELNGKVEYCKLKKDEYGRTSLEIELKKDAVGEFYKYTADNIFYYIKIIQDEREIYSARINEPINNGRIITSAITETEEVNLRALSVALLFNKLPITINDIELHFE